MAQKVTHYASEIATAGARYRLTFRIIPGTDKGVSVYPFVDGLAPDWLAYRKATFALWSGQRGVEIVDVRAGVDGVSPYISAVYMDVKITAPSLALSSAFPEQMPRNDPDDGVHVMELVSVLRLDPAEQWPALPGSVKEFIEEAGEKIIAIPEETGKTIGGAVGGTLSGALDGMSGGARLFVFLIILLVAGGLFMYGAETLGLADG